MPRTDGEAGAASESHWFEGAADHLGPTYLRYAFTKGTNQEVDFLVEALELEPGSRILDVGCGPGRHALELASRGFEVVGVDISEKFVELARRAAEEADLPATFLRQDARRLTFTGAFDAVISLCQGAFGLQGTTTSAIDWSAVDGDTKVLERIAEALRTGGRLALSAFSAYFQLRYLDESDAFDAANGVNHERTELRDGDGRVIDHDLWTSCFTPREFRLLADRVGLGVDHIWSVEPGRYARRAPQVDLPEFLVLATKR